MILSINVCYFLCARCFCQNKESATCKLTNVYPPTKGKSVGFVIPGYRSMGKSKFFHAYWSLTFNVCIMCLSTLITVKHVIFNIIAIDWFLINQKWLYRDVHVQFQLALRCHQYIRKQIISEKIGFLFTNNEIIQPNQDKAPNLPTQNISVHIIASLWRHVWHADNTINIATKNYLRLYTDNGIQLPVNCNVIFHETIKN
jgi:hypothetical protein